MGRDRPAPTRLECFPIIVPAFLHGRKVLPALWLQEFLRYCLDSATS